MFAKSVVNISMALKTSVNLIQALLQEARRNKNFDSKYQDLAFQIGYLMGLLGWLADRDSHVKSELEHRLNTRVKNNRK